jgi:collagenase-like PrtC family protease
MGAVRLSAGKPFVIGTHINTYNSETLEILAAQGATRWVMPVELSRQMLAELLAKKPQGMETEVFVYGRLPLAFSSRCFTARHHNLPKDDRGFTGVCSQDSKDDRGTFVERRRTPGLDSSSHQAGLGER